MADTTPDLSVYQAEFEQTKRRFYIARTARKEKLEDYLTLVREDMEQAATSLNNGNLLLLPSEWDSEAGACAATLIENLRVKARQHNQQRQEELDGMTASLETIWTP